MRNGLAEFRQIEEGDGGEGGRARRRFPGGEGGEAARQGLKEIVINLFVLDLRVLL